MSQIWVQIKPVRNVIIQKKINKAQYVIKLHYAVTFLYIIQAPPRGFLKGCSYVHNLMGISVMISETI